MPFLPFSSQVIHRADCPTSDSQRFRRNNQYSVITAGCLPSSDNEQVARDQRRRKVLRSDVRGSSCSLRHSHCSHTFRRSFRRRYRETGPHGCDGGPNRRCRHRYPTQRAGYDRRSINRGNHSRHYGMVCLRKRFPHRSHCCLHYSPVWPSATRYGARTAFSVQDVLLLQMTATGPRRFAGKRSPRRRSTSPFRSCALRRRPIPRFSPRSGRSAPRPISTPELRLIP